MSDEVVGETNEHEKQEKPRSEYEDEVEMLLSMYSDELTLLPRGTAAAAAGAAAGPAATLRCHLEGGFQVEILVPRYGYPVSAMVQAEVTKGPNEILKSRLDLVLRKLLGVVVGESGAAVAEVEPLPLDGTPILSLLVQVIQQEVEAILASVASAKVAKEREAEEQQAKKREEGDGGMKDFDLSTEGDILPRVNALLLDTCSAGPFSKIPQVPAKEAARLLNAALGDSKFPLTNISLDYPTKDDGAVRLKNCIQVLDQAKKLMPFPFPGKLQASEWKREVAERDTAKFWHWVLEVYSHPTLFVTNTPNPPAL